MSDKKEFVKWLKKRLTELNTDESVFGDYIMGILESDETVEEKREGLEGILSAIIETDLGAVIEEILSEWEKCEPTKEQEPKIVEDVDTKLARLMETQQIATTVQRKYTEEELKIREQILSQYSQVEYDDGYEEENDDGAAGTSGDNKDPLLMKNTNASDVAALAKERREQAKLDSKAKKEKDKEDLKKQKQLREEKKEKRKTVKGERRR